MILTPLFSRLISTFIHIFKNYVNLEECIVYTRKVKLIRLSPLVASKIISSIFILNAHQASLLLYFERSPNKTLHKAEPRHTSFYESWHG